MDEIRETPSNATLMALVKALRATRDKVRPTSEGVLPAVGRFATDAILPEGGIDELENWAYGNSPVHVPEMTNVPQFKNDTKGSRGGRALDAAGLIPIGTAAKAGPAAQAGLIFPIKRYAKPTSKELDLLRAADLAETLRGKGASFSDIWDTAKVTPVLRTRRLADDDGRWGHEVDFTPDMLKPENLLTENERLELWIKQNPEKWAKYMTTKGATSPIEMERAITTPTVREGKYKLSDLIDNPELFDQYPLTKDFDVNMSMDDYGAGVLGSANTNKLEVYQPAAIAQGTDAHSPFGTLAHETQHLVQNQFDMPRGSNPDMMSTDVGTEHFLKSALRHPYVDMVMKQLDYRDPTAFALRQLDYNADAGGMARYLNTMGEQQSRAAAERAFKSEAAKALYGPHTDLSNPQMALEVPIWKFGASMAKNYGGNVTDKELAEMIVDALMQSHGTKP